MRQFPREDLIDVVVRELRRLQLGDRIDLTAEGGAALYSAETELTSLELLSVLMALEDRFSSHYGASLHLTDAHAFAMPYDPFESIASLARFVGDQLANDDRGMTSGIEVRDVP